MEISKIALGAIDYLSGFFYTAILVLFFLIFPFFVIVSRENREKDKETAVYIIISHFYKAIVILYISLSIECCGILVHARLKSTKRYGNWFGLAMFLTVIYVQAHHFIICLLAIQKFLLYFFSTSASSHQITKKFLYFTYAMFFLTCSLCFLIPIFIENKYQIKIEVMPLYFIYYVCLNTALFISALLYIPMLIHIRKFKHLRSVKQSNPHWYIMNQTIAIVSFKIMNILFVCYVFAYDRHMPVGKVLDTLAYRDLIVTPVIVQVSYLFSNKRNIEVLKKKLRAVCFCIPKRPVAVSAIPTIEGTTAQTPL